MIGVEMRQHDSVDLIGCLAGVRHPCSDLTLVSTGSGVQKNKLCTHVYQHWREVEHSLI